MDDLDLGYLMAVSGALVWTPRQLHSWITALGDPRSIVAHVKARDPLAPAGAQPLGADAIARLALIDDAAARQCLVELDRSGSRLLTDADPGYPPGLRDLFDPPPVLYLRGDAAGLHGRAVAIVGSRAATAYGRATAANLAADFSAYGACVISGLARGIDAAAHKAAVDLNSRTVAVIGSGMSALYPPYHSLLADEIVDAGGAIVSEFPPQMPARAHQFPMRNRIVAALAQATVVVEAGVRSGALITARLADELGRAVFAIPGDVGRITSAGTNALIKDGVTLATSAADVADFLRWGLELAGSESDASGHDAVLDALDAAGSDVDELSARTGIDVARLLARLTLLEIGGLIERRPGGSFAAVKPRAPAKSAGA